MIVKYGKYVFLSLIAFGLSGCATLSPKEVQAGAIQQTMNSDDMAQLNTMMNTVSDGQEVTWHSSDGKTLYQLNTSDSTINAQGQPCRTYTFLVAPNYDRKKTTTGVACRDDSGQWQLRNN